MVHVNSPAIFHRPDCVCWLDLVKAWLSLGNAVVQDGKTWGFKPLIQGMPKFELKKKNQIGKLNHTQ